MNIQRLLQCWADEKQWCPTCDGYAEAVSMLLEAEADVNVARNDGVTPLYVAAHNGHAEVVTMLGVAGADAH
jgi:ankyrin repeat protein